VDRRTLVRLLTVAGAACGVMGHSPYRQWQAYRKSRLIIVTSAATIPLLARYDLPHGSIPVVEPGTDGAPTARGSDGDTVHLLCVATVNAGRADSDPDRGLGSDVGGRRQPGRLEDPVGEGHGPGARRSAADGWVGRRRVAAQAWREWMAAAGEPTWCSRWPRSTG